MTSTYNDSIDEMRKRLRETLAVVATPVLSYIPHVEYVGMETSAKPPRDEVWLRFSTQHVDEEQATLSTCVQKAYSRRYNVEGLLFIEFYGPKNVADSARLIGDLGEKIKAAFRGKPMNGNISFNRTRIVNVSAEDLFNRLNIVSEFDYNQIG